MAIVIKSARETATPEDGARVLVERQRPRGISRDALELRAWLAAVAPSDDLRRWFDERPRQWLAFQRRYLAELCNEEACAALSMLHAMAENEPTLTLLTRTAEQERTHGAILRDLLQGLRKPPSSSGPARKASGGRANARRNP